MNLRDVDPSRARPSPSLDDASRIRRGEMGRRRNEFPVDIDIEREFYDDPVFHAAAPDAYLCPLTLRVMRNPVVVTKTGRTYEKVAIEAWITLNHSEPYDGRVQLTNFHDECSSNTALYALIDHFVRSVRTMEPGALLDGTVTQRMKCAAAKTTVVVVERNVHVFKKQPSLPTNANVALKTLEKGLIPDVSTKNVQSDAFVFPRQRRKLIDPHLEVVSVDYPGAVMSGKEEPEPEGKWFRFKSEQLSEICGVSDWGDGNLDGWKTGVIKSGEGASFSVADRDRGVVVFQHESGLGVGCSNPCDYARAGEWNVGNRLKLLAYSNENQPPPYTFAMSIEDYVCQTETGWNLPGHLIRFGQCGLVGGWWKEMEIEFKIEEASVGTRVYGVHTDASFESLPFTVKALRSDGEWHDIKLSSKSAPWGRAFASIMDDVSAVRVRWESTDLHKLANSTYRSGGGIHASLLGTSTAFNVLDVRHSGHPADGSIFRFDKDAIRAATCGVADWQGRYEVLNLRSGKKGEVMLLDKADAKVLEAYLTTMVKESTPAAELEPVPIVAAAPPSVVVVDTPDANRAPGQPQRAKGLFSCCFPAPEPPVAPSAYVDDPSATTMVVYKDVYIDEASPPEEPPQQVPSQASAAVDVLGFGYWVDDAKALALAAGDWQIGDIIMIARADLDVDSLAPSVLEGGDAGVAALERAKSIDAAGDWANIRFILSEDVAKIPLPNI